MTWKYKGGKCAEEGTEGEEEKEMLEKEIRNEMEGRQK